MKYPMFNNWLTFRRESRDTYAVHNHVLDEDFEIDARLMRFARRLNGKRDPYRIDPSLSRAEVEWMLDELDENELVRHSRVLTAGLGTVLCALWFPKPNKRMRAVCRVCNALLLLLWLPVFAAGTALFFRLLPIPNTDWALTGFILGFAAGLVLHEAAHAFAGIAYGAPVFEFGVTIRNFLPGAYVMVDSPLLKSRGQRIQVNAAGVEMNLLLTGVCLLLSCAVPALGAAFLYAGLDNFLLAMFNIIFVDGLDGMSVLGDLLGIEDLTDSAREIVTNRALRKQLRAAGPVGHVVIAVSVLVRVLQFALPLLILLNVLEVVACFM